MMERDDHGAIARGVELIGEPCEPRVAQRAAARARNLRIERDHAQRPEIERVLDELARLQLDARGEGAPQRRAVVMVADEQVVRHRERREQRFQVCVFVVVAEVGQVARGEHPGRGRREGVQPRDAAREMRGRIDAPIRERARPLDMQIADVGKQHHRSSL